MTEPSKALQHDGSVPVSLPNSPPSLRCTDGATCGSVSSSSSESDIDIVDSEEEGGEEEIGKVDGGRRQDNIDDQEGSRDAEEVGGGSGGGGKPNGPESVQSDEGGERTLNIHLGDHSEILSTFNNALGSIINDRLDITRLCRNGAERERNGLQEKPIDQPPINSRCATSSLDASKLAHGEYDDFDEWANGSVKRQYRPTDPEAQGHVSGWAMKYTNNHNKYVLKKACIGVIVCSNCSDPGKTDSVDDGEWSAIAIRPAISDKVREKQIGKPCPNPCCKGILVHRKCRGNNGFPVVHLWSDRQDAITFESRGTHDHQRPDTRKIPTEMLELGVDPSHVFEAELRLAQQKVTRPRQRRDLNEKTKSTESQVKNTLTMDIIGCLPDNVQQAIKSFSIKPDKQHITFSFPFMVDILKQMKFREGLPRVHHVTPVLLCDDTLDLIEGFQTIITMAPNFQRGCMSIVQLTLWQKGTVEGLRRHFASLVKTLLDPHAHFACCHLPALVVDLKPTDRDQVIQACAESILELQRENLVKTFPERNAADILQMLKDTMVLPCLKSFHEYFYIALNEVGSKLPEQDAARFVALLDHMTSTKCSAYDFKRADLILRDPTLGPPIINEFWMYWGNELASCKVFPVAMAIFDAYKLGNEKSDQEGAGVTKAMLVGFRMPFRRMPIKDGLQNIIQCLKAQNPARQDNIEKEKIGRCACESCRKDPLKRSDVTQGQGPAVEFLKSLKTATEQGFAKFGLREDMMHSAFHRPTLPPFLCSKPTIPTADLLKHRHIPPQHPMKAAIPSFMLPPSFSTVTPRSPLTSKEVTMTSHEHLLTSHHPSIISDAGSSRQSNFSMFGLPFAVTSSVAPSIVSYNPLLRNTLLSTFCSSHHGGNGLVGPMRNHHRNDLKSYHPYKL
ncbi:uncharacterized protein [Ptychodera flava]|uniref:uncharacterized protein n=1 Tax=Ptychodera flava TaxID=63121 RepID=UPI003969E1EB